MKQFQIKEEKIKKLPVRFSQEIANEIEWINFRNFGNDEALSQWNDYIETIICYISDPVIAWDNMNRYRHNSYGETFIKELGMDVGFIIEIDSHTNKSFVYVFHLDLNIEKFGLNESKDRNNIIILTESDLKIIIQECIKKALCESYSIRRLGHFDVVKGDNQPHSIKGLEQYGNTLYDVRLYSDVNDKKETFAIFSIGKNASKYICCRLESDDEYGTWLGFTPIKNYDVPTMIKQDLKNNPTNQ